MQPTRFFWLIGSGLALMLLSLLVAISPVQIQLTIAPRPQAAEAGLPTTTPLPPTSIPTEAPAATPEPTRVPPAEVLPSVTPEPAGERPRPSATPEPTPPLPILQPPQVAIEKQASVEQALPGDTLSFTLLVTNRGQAPANDVIVTDEMPPPFVVIDLRSSKGDIVVDGQVVTAYPRTLAPGEEQTYTITVQLPDDATPGEYANTAVVTTTSDGDDPGDNTSTTAVVVRPPLIAQQTPPQLPRTADPLDPATRPLLAIYWPLLALACGLIGFGIAARYGLFRQRSMQITVGAGRPVGIQIDSAELIECWRRGADTHTLVELVERHNPQADRLAISIAVQRVLQDELR